MAKNKTPVDLLLAPLMIAASLLAVGHMAVNEFWTADATRKLTAWKDVDYASMPDGDTGAQALWVSDGGTVVKASSAKIGRASCRESV